MGIQFPASGLPETYYRASYFGAAPGRTINQNTDAINTAIAEINSKGGGFLQFKSGTYDKGETPLKNGVVILGEPPRMTQSFVFTGGTVFDGLDRTVDGFTYNKTDGGGDYANNAAMYADLLWNVGVRDVGMTRYKNAIKVGALYKAGCFFGQFQNITVNQWAEWAFFFENSSYSKFEDLSALNMASIGVAGFSGCYFYGSSVAASGGSNYNHGNSSFRDFRMLPQLARSRGIVFMSRGSVGSTLNDLHGHHLQCNAGGTGGTYTNSNRTTSNVSPNIAMTDATLWPIDLPVTPVATLAGFTVNLTYFVVANDGTNIQLSLTQRGTPITPSSIQTTLGLKTYGYHGLEVVATDEAAGNAIQPSTMIGLDLEGPAAGCVLVQKAGLELSVHTGMYAQGSNCINTFTYRGSCYGSFKSSSNFTADISTAFQGLICLGGQTNGSTPFPNATPVGMWYTGSPRRWVMNLGANPTANGAGLGALMGHSMPNSGTMLYPHAAMGQKIWPSIAIAKTFLASESGCWAYTGTGHTWTLPALPANMPANLTENVVAGSTWEMVNLGSGNLVITSPAPLFNNVAAKTTLTLAPGAGVTLRAYCWAETGTVTWLVTGSFGTIT